MDQHFPIRRHVHIIPSLPADVEKLPNKNSSTRPATPEDKPMPACSICSDLMALSCSASPLSPTPPKNQRECTLDLEKPVVIINCGHIFGNRCLSTWMAKSDTCPLCRLQFFQELVPDNAHREIFEARRRTTATTRLAINRQIEQRRDGREGNQVNELADISDKGTRDNVWRLGIMYGEKSIQEIYGALALHEGSFILTNAYLAGITEDEIPEDYAL